MAVSLTQRNLRGVAAAHPRWVSNLYALSQVEQPLRAAIFTVEQLEIHARALAGSQVVRKARRGERLLRRLKDNARLIAQTYELISQADAEGRRQAPAAEWLLDNYYLVEDQIRLAREHLPKGYARRLPVLGDQEMDGFPRVYDLVLQLISHLDGKVDAETLSRIVDAYQSVSPLTLGELWAVPIMLRLALIENLRRVAASMSWRRAHRDSALSWATRISEASEKPGSQAVLLLAEMLRHEPPVSTAFVAEFTQALQGRGPAVTFVLSWIEQRLAEQGQTVDQVVAAESQSEAADQVSMANSIASLRFVGAHDWHEFVEAHSRTEAILRTDPTGAYSRMDFVTRDMYRHAVERMARRYAVSEEDVATQAITLASITKGVGSSVPRHVGFYLIDGGRPQLIRSFRGRRGRPFSVGRRRPVGLRLTVYLTAVGALAVAGAAALSLIAARAGVPGLGASLTALALLVASQPAVAIVNWAASMLRAPRPLPRMDFSKGIPEEHRTIVAIPTLLGDEQQIAKLIEDVELRYLGNRDPNLWFALLSDFADAPAATTAEDDHLLDLAAQGVRELNARYCAGEADLFFLLHRPRLYSDREGVWMGRERKRGKLEDLNALLRGQGSDRFSRIVGEVRALASVRYVIVLDSDTGLPWGAAAKLAGTLAHPLNQPVLDECGRLRRGYVLLQPRVSVTLESAQASRYASLMAGEVGVDPYTHVVSDLYQDLFARASYIGKGIYHVDAFRSLLGDRFAPNAILSHDLIESCYAPCAIVSDVELLEDHPARYLTDASRRHRWIRGDWQIAPYLGLRVRDAALRSRPSAVGALGRWKIFDNLRRSLMPPALLVLLVLGWALAPSPIVWTLALLALLAAPEVVATLGDVLRRPPDAPWRSHFGSALGEARSRLARMALSIALLPHEAATSADAIARALWRMVVSRRQLLQWQTAAAAERTGARGLAGVGAQMWPAFALGVLLLAAMLWWRPAAVAAASPIAGAWILSPLLAWWLSRPIGSRMRPLVGGQVHFLRSVARLTWRYFEDFVGPEDNWLPPDNMQEHPVQRVAHRTSPTNMGLSLLANLTAWDLGYVTTAQLLSRTADALESMEKLDRFRGHFYNWYDTRAAKTVRPLYISTVDSGNLVGHLLILRQGLLELREQPAMPNLRGLRDTFSVLQMPLRPRGAKAPAGGEPAYGEALLQLVDRTLAAEPRGFRGVARWLADLRPATEDLANSINAEAAPEASWWAHALDRQVIACAEEVARIAPWVCGNADDGDARVQSVLSRLDKAKTLGELADAAGNAAQAETTARGDRDPAPLPPALVEALRQCQTAIAERLRMADDLARRCWDMAQADWQFLFDKRRKLLVIGYNVAERRADISYYDLLASEARLASYTTIALGHLPLEHWFALGRQMTRTATRPALVSWSGSMFEYLMPLLVMPSLDQTLLQQTYRAVVRRQIEYGRAHGLPWGVSESSYAITSADGNYQYRAFGVPGLGLQRGLGNDLVVTPYASAMALMVDPGAACENLERMAGERFLGAYGFYEAIDYTPARLAAGSRNVVIRSFMAHHQGMSLVAMGQVLTGRPMHRRFASMPAFRSAELLLQERVPKAVALLAPHAREAAASRRAGPVGAEQDMRVITDPSTPMPEIHLLSNGRYHVMISAAGGGYSRWNDLAINRWHEDPTCDGWGVFCYISERQGGSFWSTSYQPTRTQGRDHEAVFTQGRAEFRRHDHRMETHTEIAVSPEDDLEIRRITLTNRSGQARRVVLTSYFEAVAGLAAPDHLHRVFSNLFVQTELEPQKHAVLVTRRPRSGNEKPAWVFCLLMASGDAVGPCSFETDRERFLGRGRTPRQPQALDDASALSNTAGPVLDPCVAIRRPVEVPPDGSARLDLIIGAASTREAAMALVNKYQDYRMADRVFELSAAHSRVVLGHLGATEPLAQQFSHMALAVIYANEAYRAPGNILRRNRRGQSGLWGYGISGDYPIVLVRVGDSENVGLVRDLLMAHAYWRTKGLITDMVVWNEDVSGYRQELNDQILAMIGTGTEPHLVDKPGGIFVRQAEHVAEEDRLLVQAAARLVFNASEGPLDQQLERRQRLAVREPPTSLNIPRPGPARHTPPVSARRDLMLDNKVGGFTRDGREYVVNVASGSRTPSPWSNVIANPRLGTVVTESGSAYTWFENAQLYRLTPWHNDPVSDPSGEALYVRDDRTGRFFSPTPLPEAGHGRYVCRHGFGYSVFEHREDGLETELTQYLDMGAPVKFLVLKLRNISGGPRSVSIFASFRLVLGDLPAKHAMHVVTELDPRTGALLARNRFGPDFGNCVAFLDCSQTLRSVTADRKEFLGRNGDPRDPAALYHTRLSGRVGAGLDPCAAMQTSIELADGEVRDVVFMLGAGRDMNEALALIQRYRGTGPARVSLEEVWRFWNDRLGIIFLESPDPALNVMTNGWLPYQVLACRMWGRSGYYQSGGAYGFRDQLQDCLALLHEAPEMARDHLLRCASRQFTQGDVQHWWHPPAGRGVRTTCSDDYLWLPYAVCRYASFTGDTGVLDENVQFLGGRALREGEESYYDLPERLEESASLYEHCVRAIRHGLRVGAHGLPLMGSGDWNDGMNRVGHGGQGESTWLAFFLHHVLTHFVPLAQQRGDQAFADECATTANQLAQSVEQHAWDGQWYRRAFFDDGMPLGSAQNPECQIDSLPQSWAAISGAANPMRMRQALDSMWNRLVRRDLRVMQLFDPPFDQFHLDPGYIKGYIPGVRENGGQYTHAAVWAAMAFAMAGQLDRAWELVGMLNPVNHALDAAQVAQYRVEPYAMAADVYTSALHPGRGGWTWYTGSAGWFYHLIHSVLLGIQRSGETMSFQPRPPASWTTYKVHYRYYQTFYHITFVRSPAAKDAVQVALDGQTQPDGVLRLVNDKKEHAVEIAFA